MPTVRRHRSGACRREGGTIMADLTRKYMDRLADAIRKRGAQEKYDN
jgi:hypothetical protein